MKSHERYSPPQSSLAAASHTGNRHPVLRVLGFVTVGIYVLYVLSISVASVRWQLPQSLPFTELALEVIVDTIFVLSPVLFVCGFRRNWWTWLVIAGVAGQALISVMEAHDFEYLVELALVLSPSVTLGLLCARKPISNKDGSKLHAARPHRR